AIHALGCSRTLMPRHSSSAPIIGLLLQWVAGGPLCQQQQPVIRIVYDGRIRTSPFRKSGLFHAPSMQKSRESVIAFNAAWFGINPVLLVALLANCCLTVQGRVHTVGSSTVTS